jgi:hypothetical protein
VGVLEFAIDGLSPTLRSYANPPAIGRRNTSPELSVAASTDIDRYVLTRTDQIIQGASWTWHDDGQARDVTDDAYNFRLGLFCITAIVAAPVG